MLQTAAERQGSDAPMVLGFYAGAHSTAGGRCCWTMGTCSPQQEPTQQLPQCHSTSLQPAAHSAHPALHAAHPRTTAAPPPCQTEGGPLRGAQLPSHDVVRASHSHLCRCHELPAFSCQLPTSDRFGHTLLVCAGGCAGHIFSGGTVYGRGGETGKIILIIEQGIRHTQPLPVSCVSTCTQNAV